MPLIWCESIDELAAPYCAAPLGNKKPADLRSAFGNSRYFSLVYDGGRLVGARRVLVDGADCAYVCDIAVLPSHQGSGLGRRIVGRLVERCAGHKKIILYAVPGRESFYGQFGFRRMGTAMAIFENPQQAIERGYVDED